MDQKKTELELKLDKIFQVEPLISKEDIENVKNTNQFNLLIDSTLANK